MWSKDRTVKLNVLKDYKDGGDVSVEFVVPDDSKKRFWVQLRSLLKEVEKAGSFIKETIIREATEPWEPTDLHLDLAGNQRGTVKIIQRYVDKIRPLCVSMK